MRLFLLMLCLCFSFLSCDNEPYEGEFPTIDSVDTNFDDLDIPEDFENYFYAKLDGEEFVDQIIYTVVSTDINDSNFLAITGSINNYHSIIIYLPLEITAGTYDYDLESILTIPNLNVTYSNFDNLLESGIGDGSLTVESHDHLNRYIKGNFECVVNSENGTTHTIEDGDFEIVY